MAEITPLRALQPPQEPSAKDALAAARAKRAEITSQALKDPDAFEAAVEVIAAQEMVKVLGKERGVAKARAHTAGEPTAIESLTVSLVDLAEEEDDEAIYRIDGLVVKDGNVVIAAQRKAGKSTLIGNLVRSLVDGDVFLPGLQRFQLTDGHKVQQLLSDERVAIVDLELPRRTIKRWLTDQGIVATKSVDVHSLRGQAAEFDLLDKTRQAAWAAHFKGRNVKVLIIDPLAPLLAAFGTDENDNMGVARLLNAIDELKAMSGIEECFVAHHMGHSGDRSRGASRLRDWPDAEWMLVRERAAQGEEPPPNSARFFLAEGRDVAVPEFKLHFDEAQRRLFTAGGNRATHSKVKNSPVAVQVVTEHPGLGRNDLLDHLQKGGLSQSAAKAALSSAVADGSLHVHPGSNRSKLHFPGSCCDDCAEA